MKVKVLSQEVVVRRGDFSIVEEIQKYKVGLFRWEKAKVWRVYDRRGPVYPYVHYSLEDALNRLQELEEADL